MIADRHMGRFHIPLERIVEQPEQVKKLLSGVIVVEATTRWDLKVIDYLGISQKFEEILDNCYAPQYYVVWNGVELRFERERFPVKAASHE